MFYDFLQETNSWFSVDEHGAYTEEMSTSVQSCMDFGQSDLDYDTESTNNTEPSPVLMKMNVTNFQVQ